MVCLQRNKNKPPIQYKHGLRNTRIYSIWASMHQRCKNPRNKHYSAYGGKGIKVCSEWSDVKVFYEWAMSNGYKDTLTLDRIDNSCNYQSDNCKWSTQKEQQNNRTNNIYVTAFGSTRSINEWCKITGLSYNTIRGRIYEYGWDKEIALTTPQRARKTGGSNAYTN